MTVREFNGTSDDLVTGLGDATGMQYGTVAILLKFSTVTGFRGFFHLHDSGLTFVSAPLALTDFTAYETFYGGASANYTTNPSTGIWYLAVSRKATGSATPRLSTYDYNSATWTHRNGSGALSNGTAPGAGGRTNFSFQGSQDFFGGRVAAKAAWSNALPWSADASGDTALEAAGLEDSALNWLINNPSVFWLFNQASVGTAVEDLSSGGTGDQLSISGTTVINGDDPPGFSFSLGGGDGWSGLPAPLRRPWQGYLPQAAPEAAAVTPVADGDTGTGSEAVSALAMQMGDTGTGSEAATNRDLTAADTGTGSEQVSALALTAADTGTGSETGTPSVPVTASDTGTGSESVSALALTATDTGTGSEVVSSTARVTADTGTGSEAVSALAMQVADTGTGSESTSLDVGGTDKIGADTGTGSESVSALTLTAADTGTGSEAVAARTFGATDTGTGSETARVGIAAADTGTGSEAVSSRVLAAEDTGTGSDVVSTRALTVADQGEGSEFAPLPGGSYVPAYIGVEGSSSAGSAHEGSARAGDTVDGTAAASGYMG